MPWLFGRSYYDGCSGESTTGVAITLVGVLHTCGKSIIAKEEVEVEVGPAISDFGDSIPTSIKHALPFIQLARCNIDRIAAAMVA